MVEVVVVVILRLWIVRRRRSVVESRSKNKKEKNFTHTHNIQKTSYLHDKFKLSGVPPNFMFHVNIFSSYVRV
jgi:hypothetical protein